MKNLNRDFNIDLLLPNSLILDDLKKILWSYPEEECFVEIDGNKLFVPRDTNLEVIDKIYRKNIYNVSFGKNYFYTHVAIGGVSKVSGGIIDPVYCFSTLFYNSCIEMITVDFHSDMR